MFAMSSTIVKVVIKCNVFRIGTVFLKVSIDCKPIIKVLFIYRSLANV